VFLFIYLFFCFPHFGGVCCTPTKDVDFRDVGGPTTYTPYDFRLLLNGPMMTIQSNTLDVGPTDWHLESWDLFSLITGYRRLSFGSPDKSGLPPGVPSYHRLPLPGCFAVRTQQRRSCSALQLARARTVVVVLGKPLPRTPFDGVFSCEFCWKRRISRRRARKTSFCM